MTLNQWILTSQEVSTTGTNTQTPFSGLGLGIWAPFQPSEVPNLRSFTYDNKSGKIVQEKVKKVPTTQGMSISVLTQVPIIGDVRENPIATASVGTAFMNANEDNIRRLCQQNQEKEARIRELEEKLQQMKVDESSVQSFRESAEKVRTELEEAIIDMYAHLHLFQQVTTTIIDQHGQVQENLTQFNMIWERMSYIDQWIVENPDAPTELYHPSKMERKTYIYSLDVVNRLGKEMIKKLPNQWKYARNYTRLLKN
jgi:hypothetical protein